MDAISHSRPWITEADVDAVAKVLASGMVVQGERVRAFEAAVASWHGLPAERAVAVGSGAAAIELSLAALGLGPGDEVVFPTYVCHSVLEAVRGVGATPITCDVGSEWVVRPADVEPHVGPRTRALIIPHVYGVLADTPAFRRFGVAIVEDCAQAFGPRGTALHGDVAVFSFHATKCLTTGEGGMAVTTRPELAAALRMRRDGGAGPDGRVLADRARTLSPMPDTSAALGLSQLGRYEAALARRRALWLRYRDRLGAIAPGLGAPPVAPLRFLLRVEGGVHAWGGEFLARGVHVRSGVDRLNHRLLGLPDRGFPVAARLLETTVSLPLYPALSDVQHERCVTAALEVLAKAVPAALTGTRA